MYILVGTISKTYYAILDCQVIQILLKELDLPALSLVPCQL